MKKSFLISLFGLTTLLIVSCGKNTEKLKEAKEGISDLTSIMTSGKEAVENAKKLSEYTPFNHNDFEKWIPGESFQGMKREFLEVGGSFCDASVRMTYTNENKEEYLEIEVYDGADSAGGAVVTQLNMFLNSDINKTRDNSSDKVVEKNGIRALESLSSNSASIECVVNERFYLKIMGINLDIDYVWKIFDALKTEQLKN